MDIHDVHTVEPQPLAAYLRTVDPELLKRQARGMTAAGQAQDILQGPALANALRQQQMEMPGVAGQGFAAQGPTMLQGLAVMAGNRQGDNKVRELEAQARALRGETEDATLAELQARNQAAQIDRQAAWENAEANRANQVDRDNIRAEIREEEMRLRGEMIQGERKTFIDQTTGELVHATSRKNGKWIDQNEQPITNTNLIPYEKSIQYRRMGTDYENLKSENDRKTVNGAFDSINRLNHIADISAEMTPADFVGLDSEAWQTAIKTLVPGEWEEWARNNKWISKLTPRAQAYLRETASFAADIRHQLYGSAVTWSEQSFFNAFSPAAFGASVAERNARLAAFEKHAREKVKRVDELNATSIMKSLPSYRGTSSTIAGEAAGSGAPDLSGEISAVKAKIADFLSRKQSP